MKRILPHLRRNILLFITLAAVVISGCARRDFLYWTKKASAAKDTDLRLKYYGNALKKWKLSDGSDRKTIVYGERANLYFQKGGYEAAISDYSEALKINPNDTGSYYNRGLIYYAKGDYSLVIKDFEKVIGSMPRHFDAYNICGAAYGKLGNYEKAVSLISQAIRINPKYTQAYYNRAVALSGMGKFDRAINDFSKTLELSGKDTNAYIGRANAFYSQKRYKAAIGDYEKAAAVNPRLAIAYNNMGYIYFDEGDYKKALLNFSKSYGIDQRYWDSVLGLALVNMKLKDAAMTAKYFGEAANLEPLLKNGIDGLGDLAKKGFYYTDKQKETLKEIFKNTSAVKTEAPPAVQK